MAAFRAGTLTPAQAEAAVPSGDRAAFIFLLLQLSTTVGASTPAPAGGAHTPSATLPPYAKGQAKPRRKKRGARPGHPGSARPRPTRIDRTETHRLLACPHCGDPLHRTGQTRTRIVEDIPDDLKAEAVEHTRHRDWCLCCQKPETGRTESAGRPAAVPAREPHRGPGRLAVLRPGRHRQPDRRGVQPAPATCN